MINGKLQDALAALYTGDMLSVEVPEWADLLDDGRIYYRPLTLKDQQHLARWADKDDPQMFVELLMRKARDASGEDLFDTGARQMLMEQVPSHILIRIGNQMLMVPDADELKKS